MFTIDEIVTTSKVDAQGHLTLFAAIQMMQDCSELWIESEPEFYNLFQTENRAQLLASRQLNVIRVPQYKEHLTVKTWVYGGKGVFGLRNTIIVDENDQPCYVSWCMGAFIDKASGALKAVPDEVMNSLKIEAPYPMEYLDRRIKVPQLPAMMEAPYRVQRHDIDYNNHVNNAHYIRMVMELLPEDFSPKQLRVEYKRAIKLDDEVKITIFHDTKYYAIVSSSHGTCAILEFE